VSKLCFFDMSIIFELSHLDCLFLVVKICPQKTQQNAQIRNHDMRMGNPATGLPPVTANETAHPGELHVRWRY
jgi:hypothetical protein